MRHLAFLMLLVAMPAPAQAPTTRDRPSVPAPPAIPAQPALPDTPAGRVLAAWLTAFNSRDAGRIRDFEATYREPPAPVERTLRLRAFMGPFTLVRIERSAPDSLLALAAEEDSDTLSRLDLLVSGDAAPKMTRLSIAPTSRPADLAIPRMTEAAALSALAERVDAAAARDVFAGIVLVARDGRVLLQKTAGLANRETKDAVTPDTKFRIGSMNKMFTAVATLRLVETKKLGLDDPVGKHLPDYPDKAIAEQVTVRHLLSHRGGTGDIFGPEFMTNRLTLKEHGDYVALYGARAPLHEPDAEFRYSNYGFVLLGAIIERVSGRSYYDFVRASVFEPAGMTATDSRPETESVLDRSVGYMWHDGAWCSNADTLPWRGTAAGGGYATAGDLLKFALALEAGKLIGKDMLAQATRARSRMDPALEYGLGFCIGGEGPTRNHGHAGGASGMNGELRIHPQLGYVVVVLSNLDPPAATRMADFFANRMPVAAPASRPR